MAQPLPAHIQPTFAQPVADQIPPCLSAIHEDGMAQGYATHTQDQRHSPTEREREEED
jgi:hypothetical protein